MVAIGFIIAVVLAAIVGLLSHSVWNFAIIMILFIIGKTILKLMFGGKSSE